MKVVPIQTGDLIVAQDVLFESGAIGSGIFLCLWDPQKKMGGVALCLFTDSTQTSNSKVGLIFSQALPLLINKLTEGGCDPKKITARACGGGLTLASPPLLDWPLQFPERVAALFTEHALVPGGIDFGGIQSRSVEFNTETGVLLIKSGDQEIQL